MAGRGEARRRQPAGVSRLRRRPAGIPVQRPAGHRRGGPPGRRGVPESRRVSGGQPRRRRRPHRRRAPLHGPVFPAAARPEAEGAEETRRALRLC